jgi:hypothetical protein
VLLTALNFFFEHFGVVSFFSTRVIKKLFAPLGIPCEMQTQKHIRLQVTVIVAPSKLNF